MDDRACILSDADVNFVVDDLYRGNSDSIYWFWKGFNFRAFAAFILAVWPAMPGYISEYARIVLSGRHTYIDHSGSVESGQIAKRLDEAEPLGIHHRCVQSHTLCLTSTDQMPGFFLSSIIYYSLCRLFPPRGQGEGSYRHDENQLVLPTAYRQDVPTQGRYSDAPEGDVSVEVIDGQAVSEKRMSEDHDARPLGRKKGDLITVLRS